MNDLSHIQHLFPYYRICTVMKMKEEKLVKIFNLQQLGKF